MSFAERYFDFRPDDYGAEYRPNLQRELEQFLEETGIVVASDVDLDWWQPVLTRNEQGNTSTHETNDGSNYLYSRLDYFRRGYLPGESPAATRHVAEIFPGGRAQNCYWAKNAPPKKLTIHKGHGAVEVTDANGVKVGSGFEEFRGSGAYTLPGGNFYTLIAASSSESPFVISGFYTKEVDWSELEKVIEPGQTEIDTPDGFLRVPRSFQY